MRVLGIFILIIILFGSFGEATQAEMTVFEPTNELEIFPVKIDSLERSLQKLNQSLIIKK